MARPVKHSKIEQMRSQEEIIQKKKMEILEKQRKQEMAKQLAAAAVGSGGGAAATSPTNTNTLDPQKSTSAIPMNNFNNDGSFLENFKKISEQVQAKMKQNTEDEEIVATLPQFAVPPPAFPGNIPNVNIFNPHVPPPPPTTEPTSVVTPATTPAVPLLPELDIRNIKDIDDQLPTTLSQLIDSVAAIGDIYEEKICLRKNDVPSAFWFLFERESDEYRRYRAAVADRRREKGLHLEDTNKYDPVNQFEENETVLSEKPSIVAVPPPVVVAAAVAPPEKMVYASIDKSDSSDSDTECWREAKERNLKSLKRKALYPNKQVKSSADSTDSSDDDACLSGNHQSGKSGGGMDDSHSSNSSKSELQTESSNSQSQLQQPPAKKRKSRWGDQVAAVPQVGTSPNALPNANTSTSLSSVKRTDPVLLQYAIQNFGTTNLSEEDWKKAEDHFKINLLYQDMLRKRQEIDRLHKQGKNKYEYDSDEDATGGTWEHRLRQQEMEATQKWADALTVSSQGKHHIGDFLPPQELKKFMEKYEAQKQNKTPDLSDYKEYKLKEDNVGFQILQKLGWKEGTGLGSSGSGIVEPVNKAAQRSQNQGLGVQQVDAPEADDNEYDAYRKRMMLAYRFRPNPLNNPRRAYY